MDEFSSRFPRPENIFYGSYDISEHDMLDLCKNREIVFTDPYIIQHFVTNNHLGFFGDWIDFPAFAGDVAIYARRNAFDSEWDLVMWYLHTSPEGHFSSELYPLIRDWIEDVLSPINKISNGLWEIHSIGYLAIYGNVNGDIEYLINRNIQQSISSNSPSSLAISLAEYIDDKSEIYLHVESMTNRLCQQERAHPEFSGFVTKETINSIGNFQASCPKNYATSFSRYVQLLVEFSGLSQTSSTRLQFRVLPLQRDGCLRFAS